MKNANVFGFNWCDKDGGCGSDLYAVPPSNKSAYIVGVVVCIIVLFCLAALLVYYRLVLHTTVFTGIQHQPAVSSSGPSTILQFAS